jgi:hypothetical protein
MLNIIMKISITNFSLYASVSYISKGHDFKFLGLLFWLKISKDFIGE